MPFEVTDKVTKKTLVFERKPSEQDLMEAFGQFEAKQPVSMPKTPQGQWQGEFKEKFAPRKMPSVIKEAGKLGIEGGGMIAGAAGLGAIHPLLAPVGAGFGYAAVKGAERGLGIEKRITSVPEELKQQGKDIWEGIQTDLYGRGVGKAIEGIALGTSKLYHLIKRHIPTVTEKGAAQRVGEIIREYGIDETDLATAKKAGEVQKQIPGLTFTPGQATGKPSIIQTERTTVKSPGIGANVQAEVIAKNNQAIRQAYDKVMKGGDADDLIKLVQERERLMTDKTYALAASKTPQELGGTLTKQIKDIAEIAKKAHSAAYKNIGNIPVNTEPIQEITKSIKSEINPVNSPNYPTSILSDMDMLLKGKKPTDKIIPLYDARGKLISEEAKPVSKEIGFQDWLDISKRLSSEYWKSKQGINPNRDLTRNIVRLQEKVADALEVSTVGTPKEGAYQNAVSLFKDYAKKFYTGGIARVRQKGIEATGLRIAQADIPAQFATPDGADSLIKAIGKENAKIAMRDYYNGELSNYLKGDTSPNKIAKWAIDKSRRPVLEKYGLMGEIKELIQVNKDHEIVTRILKADPKNAIKAALGQGKDIGIQAKKLMAMAKGNVKAEQGIQRAMGDFIIDKVETTAVDKAGAATISNAKLVNALDQYKPALDIIYAKNPEKLRILHTIQDAIEILGRTAKSPTGRGSDTFELAGNHFSVLMRSIGSRFGGAALGAGVGAATMGIVGAVTGATVGMTGWEILSQHSQKNINKFMVKAMFDPEFGKTVVMMATGAPKEVLLNRVTKQMITVGTLAVMKEENQQSEPIPSDTQEYQENVGKQPIMVTAKQATPTGKIIDNEMPAEEAIAYIKEDLNTIPKMQEDVENLKSLSEILATNQYNIPKQYQNELKAFSKTLQKKKKLSIYEADKQAVEHLKKIYEQEKINIESQMGEQ